MATSQTKIAINLPQGGLLSYVLDGDSAPIDAMLGTGETFSAVSVTSQDALINVGDGVETFTAPSGSLTPAAPALIDTNSAVRVWLWEDGATVGTAYDVECKLETNLGNVHSIDLACTVIDI